MAKTYTESFVAYSQYTVINFTVAFPITK